MSGVCARVCVCFVFVCLSVFLCVCVWGGGALHEAVVTFMWDTLSFFIQDHSGMMQGRESTDTSSVGGLQGDNG